jgi:hypothetical protein
VGADATALAPVRALVPCALSPPQPPPPFGDAVLVDVSVPCSVRALGRALFKHSSEFQSAWCDQLRATDVRELPWELKPGGGAGGATVALRDVHMATPPPAAWGYLVGSTPIASRRSQTLLRAHDGRCLWVEETNHLNMPFGNTFHTALQYYVASEDEHGTSCRLRVTFKLIFSMRAAAMKGVLTSMVRGEHEKIFALWHAALTKYLDKGCVRSLTRRRAKAPPPRVAAVHCHSSADNICCRRSRSSLGAPAAALPAVRTAAAVDAPLAAPATPVAVLVAHAPHAAAVFGAGALSGAAAAIVCAAVLHALTDDGPPVRLRRVRHAMRTPRVLIRSRCRCSSPLPG